MTIFAESERRTVDDKLLPAALTCPGKGGKRGWSQAVTHPSAVRHPPTGNRLPSGNTVREQLLETRLSCSWARKSSKFSWHEQPCEKTQDVGSYLPLMVKCPLFTHLMTTWLAGELSYWSQVVYVYNCTSAFLFPISLFKLPIARKTKEKRFKK